MHLHEDATTLFLGKKIIHSRPFIIQGYTPYIAVWHSRGAESASYRGITPLASFPSSVVWCPLITKKEPGGPLNVIDRRLDRLHLAVFEA